VAGDFGRDDHGPRDGDFGLAEVGYGQHAGSLQLNAALGQTWASQSVGDGSSVDVDGTYLLAEALLPIAGATRGQGLWAVFSAYYHAGQADLRRAYLNAGLPDASSASPDVTTSGLRARLEWDNHLQLAGARLSPYADLSYTQAKLDAYTETGGGFPASVDSRSDKATELRLGANATRPLGSGDTQLLGNLEYAHRFEDRGASTSGEIIGLFGFNQPGEDYKQDWLRAGAGLQAELGGGTGVVMLNATTRGEAPTWWLAANWRRAF
jgi:outer membrane autotransporter protein